MLNPGGRARECNRVDLMQIVNRERIFTVLLLVSVGYWGLWEETILLVVAVCYFHVGRDCL